MTYDFPGDFLWGAATAAYQVEGAHRDDGKGPSIWDVFAQIPGRIAHGHSGDVACDHYCRWREDIELIQALHLNAYRLSISWARIMPSGRGDVNNCGIDFYDRLVDTLRQAGIAPLVTLYHWDLPAALQFELGGWLSPDLPHVFADYAETMFERLGDRVSHWITINEPEVIVTAGHAHAFHPPACNDLRLSYQAAHQLARAHGLAAERFRTICPDGQISVAINSIPAFPATDDPRDAAAADRAMLHQTAWHADPLVRGDYPDLIRERLGRDLPEFSEEDRRRLEGSIDYFALNYYLADIARHDNTGGPFQFRREPYPDRPRTATNWPIVPEGLTSVLRWIADRYPGLPIYITENGAAIDDEPDAEGFVKDEPRRDYIEQHIGAMHAAMRDGVDVRGYFAWSLIDNLEWSMGFTKRFGIVRCDHDTQRRTIKASGKWYAEFVRQTRSQ